MSGTVLYVVVAALTLVAIIAFGTIRASQAGKEIASLRLTEFQASQQAERMERERDASASAGTYLDLFGNLKSAKTDDLRNLPTTTYTDLFLRDRLVPWGVSVDTTTQEALKKAQELVQAERLKKASNEG